MACKPLHAWDLSPRLGSRQFSSTLALQSSCQAWTSWRPYSASRQMSASYASPTEAKAPQHSTSLHWHSTASSPAWTCLLCFHDPLASTMGNMSVWTTFPAPWGSLTSESEISAWTLAASIAVQPCSQIWHTRERRPPEIEMKMKRMRRLSGNGCNTCRIWRFAFVLPAASRHSNIQLRIWI